MKYSDAPKLSSSMEMACDLLDLNQLNISYPGKKMYQFTSKISVIGLEDYLASARE
jgi:hypothetical protein